MSKAKRRRSKRIIARGREFVVTFSGFAISILCATTSLVWVVKSIEYASKLMDDRIENPVVIRADSEKFEELKGQHSWEVYFEPINIRFETQSLVFDHGARVANRNCTHFDYCFFLESGTVMISSSEKSETPVQPLLKHLEILRAPDHYYLSRIDENVIIRVIEGNLIVKKSSGQNIEISAGYKLWIKRNGDTVMSKSKRSDDIVLRERRLKSLSHPGFYIE